MKNTDWRSDTVTQPTPEMREAIASALVGDDVYGDDPTVNELERQAAERLGQGSGIVCFQRNNGESVRCSVADSARG